MGGGRRDLKLPMKMTPASSSRLRFDLLHINTDLSALIAGMHSRTRVQMLSFMLYACGHTPSRSFPSLRVRRVVTSALDPSKRIGQVTRAAQCPEGNLQ